MVSSPDDNCLELQPQLAAYALGEVDAEAEVQAHLAACPNCQQTLRDYARVARALHYDAPEVLPAPELRARILAAVEQAATPQMRPAPAPARRRSGMLLPAFGILVATLLVLLAWNFSLQRQLTERTAQVAASRANWGTMARLLNAPDLRWYALSGDPARGHLWASAQEQTACLVAQGLPTLASNQLYQVWLLRGTERTNGGVFEAHDGNGWLLIQPDEPVTSYDRVRVTIEPRGGSQAPTGPAVLEGALPSNLPPTPVN